MAWHHILTTILAIVVVMAFCDAPELLDGVARTLSRGGPLTRGDPKREAEPE